MTDNIPLAVIGGSGLYDLPQLQERRELHLDTPFGAPSAPIQTGVLHGVDIAFLTRHGRGHTLAPGEINYRANIFALKTLGVENVISVSACGSLREDYQPGEFVIPDQLFDFTKHRRSTFFEAGLVGHIGTADPFCPELSSLTERALAGSGGTVHAGGAFITVEGPRFSTRLESNTFRTWGMSIIGMTTAPEAFLAREAELCYTALAHVTDYDVWHAEGQPVSLPMVVESLDQNTPQVQHAMAEIVRSLADRGSTCQCRSALRQALITDPEHISPHTYQKLKPLISKYL